MNPEHNGHDRKDEDGRILYDGPQDVPDFASDDEEAEWYSTHVPSDAYLAKAKVMDPIEAAREAERALEEKFHA